MKKQYIEVSGVQNGIEAVSKTRAATLESLIAEHAALVAVAEAAQDAESLLDSLDLRPAHQATATQLREALANLAAVRGESEGGK